MSLLRRHRPEVATSTSRRGTPGMSPDDASPDDAGSRLSRAERRERKERAAAEADLAARVARARRRLAQAGGLPEQRDPAAH